MRPARSRRSVLVALGVAMVLATAGCGAILADSTTSTDTTPVENGTVSRAFPDPPETLTRETAARTAARYHLSLLLRRVDPDRASEYESIPRPNALATSVVPRAGPGFYVTVGLPASAETLTPTDALDQAVYRMEPNATPEPAYPVRRRSVEPFSGDGPAAGPVAVRIANFDADFTRTTVVVTSLDGAPETALLRAVRVPPGSVLSFDDAIGTAGRYRVTIVTGTGTRSRIVTVTDEASAPIGVYLDRDGTPEIYPTPT